MRVGRVAGGTDTGRKRRRNEDAYVVQPPLFAVADGMGGPQAGEVASRLAAAAVRESSFPGSAAEQVAELIQEANRRVWQRSNEDRTAAGMGTTMIVALVEDGHVVIGHVGDSRMYRLRDGRLDQLTEDHSLVAELMRSGKLSPEEARIHPQRSVITRALGTDPDVDVDVYTVETRPEDIYLLCSDGLFSMLEDDEIEATLERNRADLDTAARELIRQANREGGEDNITVVCFEIAGVGEDTVELSVEELDRTREQALPPALDEDTLDESDEVPTVSDTMIVSAAALQAAAPEPPRRRPEPRRGLFAPILLVLLVALIVALAVWGFVR